MADVFWFLCIILLLGGIGIMAFKYKKQIHKYIHDPKYGSTWYPSRKTYLQRKIEDAQAEIIWLEEQEEKEE